VNIGVAFGKLRTLHDGMGEFALQLGQRLAARAPALAEEGIHLHFHMRPERFGLFGDAVRYVPAATSQKVFHAPGPRFALWHRLHQQISHRAPVGTRCHVVTVHDFNYLYAKQGASRFLHAFKGRLKLLGADLVVTDTRYVAGDVRGHGGFKGPVETIHLGARSLVGDPQEAVEGVEAGRYLFHLSRMAASKNVAAILGLAAAWPEQGFVLAGPASGSVEAVRVEAAARGLANVRILTDVSDAQKAWLYAHCAGFLFPSFTEGFGLPPLESMHFGKPAFLSTLTCLPEIGGEEAWYFRDFEAGSMRRVVEQGLAEAARPGKAEAIRRQAARFSWDACADAYLALYRRLLGVER
jgi:glycosyltransferase involved in cell wall biosynthesis